MSSVTAPQRLRRFWQSVPLHRLKQGSSLTVTSNVNSKTFIQFKPSWRDDGIAELQSVFENDGKQCEILVKTERDRATSMPRSESHVSIELRDVIDTIAAESSALRHVHPPNDAYGSVLPHTPRLSVEKAILDDERVANRPLAEYANLPKDAIRTDYHDGVAHIQFDNQNPSNEEIGTYLTVQIPEKTNIVCSVQNGSISIGSKVEGDVRLRATGGNIAVKKLRGHIIELQTDSVGSSIVASSLLEAQKLSVKTRGRFRAKQVHASNIDVEVAQQKPDEQPSVEMYEDDDEGSLVDVSSLFVSGSGGATVSVKAKDTSCQLQRRCVRIKSHHGPLSISTDGVSKPTQSNRLTGQPYPIVELGGVNGSCEVAMSGTQRSESGTDDWTSCLVHVDSLAHDSVSLVSVDHGDVSITLDRKAEADLRLASLPNAECIAESGLLLADEEDSELLGNVLRHLPTKNADTSRAKSAESIKIITKAFTKRSETSFVEDTVAYVDGWVENRSEEPDSRFEQKARGAGKIRHEGAADQALHGFGGEASNGDDVSMRPLVAAVGTGTMTVETVSWLGAIARRYGLEETEKRELGRTASRRGRPTGVVQ